MNFSLISASIQYKTVLQNLMQFYIYDFSEYMKIDVEDDGLFAAYPQFEEYWQADNSRLPYIIKQNDKYIGFVLLKVTEAFDGRYFSVAEFFILRGYRRIGIGKAVATELFNLHKGQW